MQVSWTSRSNGLATLRAAEQTVNRTYILSPHSVVVLANSWLTQPVNASNIRRSAWRSVTGQLMDKTPVTPGVVFAHRVCFSSEILYLNQARNRDRFPLSITGKMTI